MQIREAALSTVELGVNNMICKLLDPFIVWYLCSLALVHFVSKR